MARKKRLNTATVLGTEPVSVPNLNTKAGYSTAAYVRLSMEDSGKIDGYSLQNQEALLMEFINSHSDLHLYKMYVDNGFTGTQFERPAFEEMMQDMRNGIINCIVVKDLSRLGRNYLEAGNYLEQIFPFFKVRFISITDGYDSISPDFTDEALIIPLRNIINEGYAKDISIKVSSAFETRKKQGKYMAKNPVYGYLKDPDDKNHLIIDPEASLIVKRIFQMRLDGDSLGKIAKTLNDEGIPCPSKYFVLKGISKETKYLKSYWSRNTTNKILRNRMYLGCLVYGKSKSSFAKGIKEHTLPESEWKIVEGTHEPLITQELFDEVQEILEESCREAKNHASYAEGIVPNLFRGIVKCAECGSSMKMSKFRRTSKDKPDEYEYYGVYECARFNMIREYSCPKKTIHKETLDMAVEESLRYHINLFLDLEKVIADLNKKTSVRNAALGMQGQIKKKLQRIAKIEKMASGIYEDYRDGILNETEYLALRKNYADEVFLLSQEVDKMLSQQTLYAEDFHSDGSLAEIVHQYANFKELNRDLIEAFISEVRVHTDGRLTIIFRFEDEIKNLQAIADRRKEEAS